jgi:hypothetical protein
MFETEWDDYEELYDRISRDRKPLRKLTERATVPVQGRERG